MTYAESGLQSVLALKVENGKGPSFDERASRSGRAPTSFDVKTSTALPAQIYVKLSVRVILPTSGTTGLGGT